MNKHIHFASSSEDEFPDLDVIFQRSKQIKRQAKTPQQESVIDSHDLPRRTGKTTEPRESKEHKFELRKQKQNNSKPSSTTRRRKLGQQSDNLLLKRFGTCPANEGQNVLEVPIKTQTKRTTSVKVRELRARDQVTPPAKPLVEATEECSEDSTNDATEITEADISEFFYDALSEIEDDDDTPSQFDREEPAPKSRPPAVRSEGGSSKAGDLLASRSTPDVEMLKPKPSSGDRPRLGASSKESSVDKTLGRGRTRPRSTLIDLTDGVTDSLRRLDLDTTGSGKQDTKKKSRDAPQATPPSTPPRLTSKTLLSPKKLPAIPKTPHGPSMDLFWSQEFVDEWNEEHSPKKLILPPAQKSPAKSAVKAKTNKTEAAKQKETKRSFEKTKHDLAQAFLRELDDNITQGKLQSLAESTGGVQIKWSAKLSTTAGRANWRRETVHKVADGIEKSVTHRHHASIELAEKVIDDENRLLNVVAHEFCHLANFMVNGITGNPHGKEFKIWASKCSQTFGDRGIEVTTKHSYEIDFKYIWECAECGLEYKRHSKSINPERHRCGSCKAQLKQTKPLPRAAAKPSEYQQFFKEQMKIVKQEHPKSPQKEVMKIIADRWAKRGGSNRATPETESAEASIDNVGARLNSIKL
ncbi:HMG box-containing protein C19G7.04 [Colletotrichum gloeosporioides]|uniref:HMG box-containing protein C19G7.04 n=1 Tax=Colletotrichum gloeosporioides TaxID=474922 RepID=A0A8H4CCC7_COLGL|nr:HMG box-containing protein C19G7.04 [Colletotrichum gloeosporioides]KAF3801072.1 HMG box-containing protein C19G7.04 [Colletotrichum gloeosporioides]